MKSESISSYPSKQMLKKLQSLSPQRYQEAEDFVDFLMQRDESSKLAYAAMQNSETSFRQVWDNEEDAVYDHL